MNTGHEPSPIPPEASPRAHRLASAVARPLERFMHVEASSGILLLVTALFALLWANSPWASVYEHLLHTPIALGFGEHTFTRSVHFWINDVLMVVFFFVVGLEVRRELHEGELSQLRRAALPVAAALGGMIAPAAIYLAINGGTDASRGWGVPMATDIAFAVGVLALLGRRVPAALRVLLLALAIIDDIGAILVIALFYSSEFAWLGLVLAGAGIIDVLIMQRFGVRNSWAYIVPGLVIWGGMLHAGVHPTIAGVILGLLTPVRSWLGHRGFRAETHQALDRLHDLVEAGAEPRKWIPDLERINFARREAIPPVTRIEAALHPYVAYGIMPLFALANAGVALHGIEFTAVGTMGIALGVGLGLVVGKPLGIVLFAWLAVKLGWAALPRGVTWGGVAVVGVVAGIGFTMALFIGALAFEDPSQLAVAKAAVLGASLLAGVVALVGGRWLLPAPPSGAVRRTVDEAEHSTEE
jgi:Na+:H+ antiporter, NhaA family